jgi:hypothetical protein
MVIKKLSHSQALFLNIIHPIYSYDKALSVIGVAPIDLDEGPLERLIACSLR